MDIKELKSFKLGEKGFSLIEVIIVVSIMGVMSLVLGQFLLTQVQSVSYTEDRLSRISLEGELRSHFSKSENCMGTLSGTVVDMDTSAKSDIIIKDKDGTIIYDPTSGPSTYDSLEISKTYVQNLGLSATEDTGAINIVVELSRRRKGGGPAELKPIVIKKEVGVNGTDEVDTCLGATLNGCLDYLAHYDTTGEVSVRIPDDAVVMQIEAPSRTTQNFNGEGEASGRPRTSGPLNSVFYVGISKAAGRLVEAGGTIRFNTSRNAWQYEGAEVFKWHGWDFRWIIKPGTLSGTMPATCPTVPRPPSIPPVVSRTGAASSQSTGHSMGMGRVIFWKSGSGN